MDEEEEAVSEGGPCHDRADAPSEPLPLGWAPITHVGHDSELYMHISSRVVLLTRPHLVPSRDVANMPLPPATKKEQAILSALSSSVRVEPEELKADVVPSEQLAGFHHATILGIPLLVSPGTASTYVRPAVPYRAFDLRLSDTPAEAAIGFLRLYCWRVLGCVAELRERRVVWDEATRELTRATAGSGPPRLAEVHVEGLCLGRAMHSNVHQACGAAAEDALLRLCPLLWEAQLRSPELWPVVVSQGGQLVARTIVSPARLATLRLDDDSILDLDASVSKSASLLFVEYCVLKFGQSLHSSTIETLHRTLPWMAPGSGDVKVFRVRTSVGPHVGIAEHVSKRRATQLSRLELLRAAHPGVELWAELVPLWSADLAGHDAVKGAAGPAKYSATAQQLLASDRRTQRSAKMIERLIERQSLLTEGAPTAEGAGAEHGAPAPDGGAGGDAHRGVKRVFPGEGSDFVTHWQKQLKIESIRKQKMAEGDGAELGTNTAAVMEICRSEERPREQGGRDHEAARERLRHAMASVDAIEVTEAMRLDEPSSLLTMKLGDAEIVGGADVAVAGAADPAAGLEAATFQWWKKRRHKWEPWKEGEKGHEVLMEIAKQGKDTRQGPHSARGMGRSGELTLLGQ